MNLSKYFTLEEATFSETAARHGIENQPDELTLSQMKRTAEKLDAVREFLNVPVYVSSWLRVLELNRKIGSKDSSQHVKGEAVDFKAAKFGTPKDIVDALMTAGIEFDQLILEFNSWVHVSFRDESNRGQVLVIDNQGTRVYKG